MWSRKRIDIGWRDLLFAVRRSLGTSDPEAARIQVEASFHRPDRTLACLSVRSGFDLYLRELQLPPGSEVLMSAVTIRHMARIVEEHGLVPVPVDLNPKTMAPDLDALQRAVSSRSRVLVVAHLFGAISDLSDVIAECRRRGILVVEDCAQAFDGQRYVGHPDADVVMFSFGPIKTATALAGGMLIVNESEMLQRMRAVQRSWPVQPAAEFARRIRTYAMLKLISGRFAFACLVRACRLMGRDYDQLLNGAIRNFPADRFFESLRRQPCGTLLLLMDRRIRNFDQARQDRRAELGRLLQRTIQGMFASAGTGADRLTGETGAIIPSAAEQRHTWWVFPLCVAGAESVISALRREGFDATCGSQLQPVDTPAHRQECCPLQAQAIVRRMMFLPLYPEMPDRVVEVMGTVVGRVLVEQTMAGEVLAAPGTTDRQKLPVSAAGQVAGHGIAG